MKVKNLIRELQNCDPNAVINVVVREGLTPMQIFGQKMLLRLWNMKTTLLNGLLLIFAMLQEN
jgi:hypothetical protein